MDELEVAFSNTSVRTDCNHIFLNFVPTVIMDPSKVSDEPFYLFIYFLIVFHNSCSLFNYLCDSSDRAVSSLHGDALWQSPLEAQGPAG